MMIFKGNVRSGAGQLAAHLLNTDTNDHVSIHEVRGFASDDVNDAFHEAYALSKATKCKKYIYSLSLNPPMEAKADIRLFERAIDKSEKAFGA